MMTLQVRHTALAASIILAVVFIVSGIPKIVGLEMPVMEFAVWGYPDWLRVTVGFMEVVGGGLLLFRRATPVAAVLLGAVIAGAAWTHWSHEQGMEVLRPAIFGAMLLIIVWQRRAGQARPDQEGQE